MADFEVARAFDLESDEALGLRVFRVDVDEHGHDVSVDDVDEGVAVGDDFDLIPFAGLMKAFISSEVPSWARSVGFLSGSVATTWPRQAMMPRGELCSYS